VCLWGDPGIGKSALIQAAAAADGVPCETVIGSLREPSDFAGLPVVTDEGVRMEPPSWARRLHAAQAGYLFLDELSTSPPAVQAAMLGVALERRVGDLLLPRAVQVVAAANPPERAADGWDLAPPLANRFLHISYTPAVDGWIDGMTAGFGLPAGGRVSEPNRERTAIARASVAGFIRCRPALLDACPTNPAASGRAWPTSPRCSSARPTRPRAWSARRWWSSIRWPAIATRRRSRPTRGGCAWPCRTIVRTPR
jgi:hypothetical protein